MDFEEIVDPNFGFILRYPSGWAEIEPGIPNMRLLANETGSMGYFLYIFVEGEILNKNDFVRELTYRLFGIKADKVDELDSATISPKVSKNTYRVSWTKDPSVFILEIFFIDIDHSIFGYHFSERLAIGVTYEENISRRERGLMEELVNNIVKGRSIEKHPSPMGFNVPRIPYTFSYEINEVQCEKWSLTIPITWRILEQHDGFLVEAGGNIVGVNPYLALTKKKIDKDEIEQLINTITHKHLQKLVEKIDIEIIGDSEAKVLGFIDNGIITIYSEISIKQMYDSTNQLTKIPIVKFAIFPTWLQNAFLPIAIFSLKTWLPGPCFMKEILGYTSVQEDIALSQQLVEIEGTKIRERKTTRTALPKKTKESSRRHQIFREKLSEDLKKIMDWSENIWSETYQTIKQSDIITGMYTLEDKQRRKILTRTENVASPYTHNFWKHKKGATHQTVVATSKPFTPKNKWEWEKLKWHWDEELKRLKKETQKRKKQIDDLFK